MSKITIVHQVESWPWGLDIKDFIPCEPLIFLPIFKLKEVACTECDTIVNYSIHLELLD